MKIAFVAYDRAAWVMGPTVNARRLLPELKSRGYDPIALILHDGSGAPTAEILRSQGIACHVAPRERYTEDQIKWFLGRLSEIRPDIFVPNVSVAGWYAASWARRAGIPTVAAYRRQDVFHEAMVDTFVNGTPRLSVSALISVTATDLQRVASRNPGNVQLAHIPSGVPLPSAPVARHTPFKLIYLGRLAESSKRIRQVLNAARRVLNTFPECRLDIIGDGPDELVVQRFIAGDNFGNRVRCRGYVSPDALTDVLQDASAVLQLSAFEGTPGSLMDSMAHGLVPICRGIPGGVRELVCDDETGILLEPEEGIAEEHQVVEAVRKLLTDERRWQRLSRAARQHIADGYSLKVAADRWEQLFADLRKTQGRRRKLRMPLRVALPPVHPSLKCEDRRRPGFAIKRRLRKTTSAMLPQRVKNLLRKPSEQA